MRITCVHTVEHSFRPGQPLSAWSEIPFGLATIAAILEEAGHQVECLVLTAQEITDSALLPRLQRSRADLLALSAVTTQFPSIREVARIAKLLPQAPYTVLGGHHASLAPDDAMACPWLDAICIGEGDRVIAGLVADVEAGRTPTDIEHLWIRQPDGSVQKNAPAPTFLDDLDSLPVINRSAWERWVANPRGSAVILVGRGCPYTCTYCSNHALMALSNGRYLRVRSVEHVLAELADLEAQNPALSMVYLEVETIAAMPRYAEELCAALAERNRQRERPLEFGCNLAITSALVQRGERMEKMLAALAAANMTYLNVGLESGSQRIRSEVLRRPKYSNDDLIAFCQAARRHGIGVNLNIIIGLPTETVADYLETVDVARRCRPASIQHNIFYPYAGTDLYDTAAEMGLFQPATLGHTAERRRPYLDLPDFPRWRLRLESVLVFPRVFHGDWPASKVAVAATWQGLRPYPRLTSTIKAVGGRSQRLRAVMDRHREIPVGEG